MRELIEFSKPLDCALIECLDAEVLCTQAISSWRMRHPEQPHDRILLKATKPGAAIDVDPAKMRDALLHLLENAHQHAPAGTCVEASIEGDAVDCRIRILDRGPGVKPDLLARIYEPFFTTAAERARLRSCRTSEHHGGGITHQQRFRAGMHRKWCCR
jgi:signal transduction histidine kinase